jgi:ParB family chromosome partitioning protein
MWGFDNKRPKYKNDERKLLLVPVADILPNPDQPRREFAYDKLLELAQSIDENGLLHPISITFRDNRPVLVAGERRLRAAKMVGMREIPCLVVRAPGEKSALMALVENLQREDMNVFEEAEGVQRLIHVYGLTQDEAAHRLGCAQSTVANKLRLLKLTPEQRELIIKSGLSERHARVLLRLEDPEQRQAALERIIAGRLTVAQAERLVDELLEGKAKRRRPTPLVRDVRLFLNTVNHAVDTMRRSGIPAQAEKSETAEYIEYVVRIPKGGKAIAEVTGIHTA